MSKCNQEGYRTLGWIINKSEQGLFLVVANEVIQKEIVDLYRQGEVEVYQTSPYVPLALAMGI